ncbi:hypothetical protein ERJ75_000853700 [Trypanosoma vivax]|nr:hypothetical protein ERJ75_000853700 [Trypanosoma vivax]
MLKGKRKNVWKNGRGKAFHWLDISSLCGIARTLHCLMDDVAASMAEVTEKEKEAGDVTLIQKDFRIINETLQRRRGKLTYINESKDTLVLLSAISNEMLKLNAMNSSLLVNAEFVRNNGSALIEEAKRKASDIDHAAVGIFIEQKGSTSYCVGDGVNKSVDRNEIVDCKFVNSSAFKPFGGDCPSLEFPERPIKEGSATNVDCRLTGAGSDVQTRLTGFSSYMEVTVNTEEHASVSVKWVDKSEPTLLKLRKEFEKIKEARRNVSVSHTYIYNLKNNILRLRQLVDANPLVTVTHLLCAHLLLAIISGSHGCFCSRRTKAA